MRSLPKEDSLKLLFIEELRSLGAIAVSRFPADSPPIAFDLQPLWVSGGPGSHALHIVVTLLLRRVMYEAGLHFHHIAGVSSAAGELLVACLTHAARTASWHVLHLRPSEAGSDAIPQLIDVVGQGCRVLLVDDIVHTGRAAAAATAALARAGLEVTGLLALVDARRECTDLGFPVCSVCTVAEICDLLYGEGHIPKQDHDRVLQYYRAA